MGEALGPPLPEPQAQRRTRKSSNLLQALSPLLGPARGEGMGGGRFAATRAWENVGEGAPWRR